MKGGLGDPVSTGGLRNLQGRAYRGWQWPFVFNPAAIIGCPTRDNLRSKGCLPQGWDLLTSCAFCAGLESGGRVKDFAASGRGTQAECV